MSSKTCVVCGEVKLVSDFPEIKHSAFNYHKLGMNRPSHEKMCRSCKAEYARQWRKKNKGYNGTGAIRNIPVESRLLMSAIGHRLACAKQRAKKYSQPEPTVDKEYLHQLYLAQQGRCALSGVPLRIEKAAIAGLSLDKIHPENGYIHGNVQWVAWAVNRAKGDMDEAVFIDMCRHVLEHQKVQRLSKSSES